MIRVAILVIMWMLVTGLWSGSVEAIELPRADFYVATNGSDINIGDRCCLFFSFRKNKQLGF